MEKLAKMKKAKSMMADANEEITQINSFLAKNNLTGNETFRDPHTGDEIPGTPRGYTFQDRILYLLKMQVQCGKVYINETAGCIIKFNKNG